MQRRVAPCGLQPAALGKITRIPPQHSLQLLGREPPTQPPPRVGLGSLDECLTKALIQMGETLLIAFGNVRLRICHDDEGSANPRGLLRPSRKRSGTPARSKIDESRERPASRAHEGLSPLTARQPAAHPGPQRCQCCGDAAGSSTKDRRASVRAA